MSKIVKLNLFLIVTFCFGGCILFDPPWMMTSFCIDNRSDEGVYVFLSRADGKVFYPDTCLPEDGLIYGKLLFKEQFEEDILLNPIAPNTRTIFTEVGGDLRRVDPFCDTVSVFVFNKDTFEMYGYENVRQNYRILVRYDLSISDIRSLQFCLPYPPDESMKNMKMYPPYESFQP